MKPEDKVKITAGKRSILFLYIKNKTISRTKAITYMLYWSRLSPKIFREKLKKDKCLENISVAQKNDFRVEFPQTITEDNNIVIIDKR